MKSYIKLVNFEVNRFFKIYVVLMALTMVSQLIGSIVVAKQYMNEANKMMYKNMMPKSQFIEQYGQFSFAKIVYSEWFVFPILLCIASLMIYIFFIWYRDWLGKNTFAYRLLTLPVERITIYLAKLKAIMLFVLGLVSLQVVLVVIEMPIMKVIVPDDLRFDIPFHWVFTVDLLSMLYPNSMLGFICIYGLGLVFVSVLFTTIVLERSYRWKGIIVAVVYGGVAFIAFIAPILLNSFVWINYFYPMELFWMMVAMSIVILVSAIWIANYLLKYKIKI